MEIVIRTFKVFGKNYGIHPVSIDGHTWILVTGVTTGEYPYAYALFDESMGPLDGYITWVTDYIEINDVLNDSYHFPVTEESTVKWLPIPLSFCSEHQSTDLSCDRCVRSLFTTVYKSTSNE